MKKARHDVLIVGASGSRSALHWLIVRLAKHPGWVTSMTFFGGAVAAWVVLATDDRLTLTEAVTLAATLWALFFAVMIYLLSAEDTDNILGQISDLQDQLSTALSEPDIDEATEGDLATSGQSDAPPALPDAVEPMSTVPEGPDRKAPATEVVGPPAAGRRSVPGDPAWAHKRSRDQRLRVLTTPAEIVETVPTELIDGWSGGTGLPEGAIRRAWSRDPGLRQWVLETDDDRWLAFFRHGDDVALVPLHPDMHRERRSRTRQGGPKAGESHGGQSRASSPRGGPQGQRRNDRDDRSSPPS